MPLLWNYHVRVSSIAQMDQWCGPKMPGMTYNLLTGLHVGDAVRISNAATKASDLFKVVAIERDVDKFGTPLPTLGHQRTIRLHATKEVAQHTIVHRHFFATERRAHLSAPSA